MRERAWFERHPMTVAFDLLGKELIVEREDATTSGRIVEVEAYGGPDDLAAHSGRLKAAKPLLFGEAGHLYVYRSYGIHTMVNVVAHTADRAGGILIRAAEPLQGIETQQRRRATTNPRLLTRGPGVLTQALGLTLGDNGYDLLQEGNIRLRSGDVPSLVIAGPRIGISRSVDHPWRLFDGESEFVSSHRRGATIDTSMLQELIEAGESA